MRVAPPILLLLSLLLLSACGASEEGGPNEAAGGSVSKSADPSLRFGPDGTFTIVHFTDTQDDQDIDPRTVRLMEAVLDAHGPDLVIFTGDNVRSGPETPDDVRKAIDAIAQPVDSRGIPWLVTFGNHDEDHTPRTRMDESAMLEYYMSFPNNLNRPGPEGISGTGNMQVLVYGSDGEEPQLNIWALDSGRYSSDSFGDQPLEKDGLRSYDWIRPSQIGWYDRTSREIENRFGNNVPGLMFFHIPIPEFALMWEHRENHDVVGKKNEDVAAGPFNSGLFGTVKDRGDVRGIFVGHDHVNDYVGDYFGVVLGYSANTGFGTYGLDGDDPDRLRGARVIVVDQKAPESFETFMVYARDFGIR